MYQVIARKYRPQAFSQVISQEHVKQTLVNAIVQKRIGHGYIFSGPRGTGKTTLARIFAKSLNCEKGPIEEPCLKCASCLEIASGSAIDLTEIDAASNRRIDDIRELRENVRYRPVRDRYKVYIIDEAHQITTDAFNALLKTLEEPPEWVVFILCTTEPQQFPATIVSRCQTFPFHTVDTDQVVEYLKWLCLQEDVTADQDALIAIALAGDGSIRDSLSILEQAIVSFGKKLETTAVQDLLGVIPSELTDAIRISLIKHQPEKMLEIVDQLYREGRHLQRFCAQLVTYFRNLLVLKISGEETRLVACSNEDRQKMSSYLQEFGYDDLTRYLALSLDLYRDLQHSSHPRFRLEVGLLKLVHAGRLTSIEEILSKWNDAAPGTLADVEPLGNQVDTKRNSNDLKSFVEVSVTDKPSNTGSDPAHKPSNDLSGEDNLSKQPKRTLQSTVTDISSEDIQNALVTEFRKDEDNFTADALDRASINYVNGNVQLYPSEEDTATLQINLKAVEAKVHIILGENPHVTLSGRTSDQKNISIPTSQLKTSDNKDSQKKQEGSRTEKNKTKLEDRVFSDPEVKEFQETFEGLARDIRDLRKH